MATATQQYPINQEFQLCTVAQLKAFNSSEYSWAGRHLVSCIDDGGELHQFGDTVTLNKANVDVSCLWVLDEHYVSASIPSGHGKIKVTVSCAEPPIPAGVPAKTKELEDGLSTKIFYNSILSIECEPDDDYKAKFMRVNGVDKQIDTPYVSGKTGTSNVVVSSEFLIDTDKAGLSIQTVNGAIYKFIYNDDISSILRYNSSNSNAVVYPFNRESNLTNTLSIASLSDSYGIISAISSYSFSGCKSLSSIYTPGVTTIKGYAFFNCEKLSSAIFGDIVKIDDNAFAGAGLTSFDAGRVSVLTSYTFARCKNMVSVNLPNLVSSYSAFQECTSLTNVNAPELIYDSHGFKKCLSLSTIYLPSAEILNGSFNNDSTPGSNLRTVDAPNVKQLGQYTFRQCEQLTSINMPKLSSIDADVFTDCKSLSSIDLSHIKTIKSRSFMGCSSLQSVDISNLVLAGPNVEYIFKDCSSLTAVTNCNLSIIPSYTFANCVNLDQIDITYAKDINSYAFYGCASLSNINIGSELTSIGQEAFSNCTNLCEFSIQNPISFSSGIFKNCSNLTSVIMPNAYTLGNGTNSMFYNCRNLKEVDLRKQDSFGSETFRYCLSLTSLSCNNISSIGDDTYGRTFLSCISLSSIFFNNVTKVSGPYLFGNCSSLTSISLPKLSSIDSNAAKNMFSGCSNLSILILSGTNEPPSINVNLFNDCPAPVSVYVKDQNMVDMFLTDTNWYTLSANETIKIIPVEGTTTLPEETIPEGIPVATGVNNFNYGNDLWW